MRVTTLALAALALAALPWNAPPRADGSADIFVIRTASGCPGIPGLDVRIDGQAPAILGAGELVRFAVTPGEHHLVFYPAMPENIAVAAGAAGRHAFLVTSFRLGWRCKFGVEPVAEESVEARIAAAKEVPVALARDTSRPLAADQSQLILKQP